MEGIVYVGHQSWESRQRVRQVGISMPLIHELALILDLAGEELAAIHALKLTYSKIPPGNWFYEEDERITHWTLEKLPYDQRFEHNVYLLEVHTWMEPLENVNKD